jgi:hypothetical protein
MALVWQMQWADLHEPNWLQGAPLRACSCHFWCHPLPWVVVGLGRVRAAAESGLWDLTTAARLRRQVPVASVGLQPTSALSLDWPEGHATVTLAAKEAPD